MSLQVSTNHPRLMLLVLTAGAACAASESMASVTVGPTFLTVRAETNGHVGLVTIPTGLVNVEDIDGDGNSDYWWYDSINTSPMYEGVNANSGNVVAQVARISASAIQVGLDFNNDDVVDQTRWVIDIDFMMSGSTAGNTKFDVYSPVLSFGPVGNAAASTSGTLVGLDSFNDDHLTVTPSLPSGMGFESLFNGNNVFRQYFDHAMSSTSTVGDAGNMSPADSFLAIPGLVGDMSFHFSFTATPGDDAGGTASYAVIPAPSGLGLMAISLLGLGRRRR